MALSNLTKRRLAYMLGSKGQADKIATLVASGSGALATWPERGLRFGMGSRRAANLLITALEADSALGDFAQCALANGVCSRICAANVSGELG